MSAQTEPVDPPANRRFRLATVRGCRRELAAVYAEARQNRLDWQSAARAASILAILSRMIEGSELEARLDALERTLAERDQPPRRLNGGQHHGARL